MRKEACASLAKKTNGGIIMKLRQLFAFIVFSNNCITQKKFFNCVSFFFRHKQPVLLTYLICSNCPNL